MSKVAYDNTVIFWCKSHRQTFSELIIEVDVTDYFICNCWTQVTKLAISTTNFVAKNNTDSMVQILSSNFS